MKEVHATWTNLFIRLEQKDLDDALRKYVLKLYPKYKKGYKFNFPKLGMSDTITAEIEMEE